MVGGVVFRMQGCARGWGSPAHLLLLSYRVCCRTCCEAGMRGWACCAAVVQLMQWCSGRLALLALGIGGVDGLGHVATVLGLVASSRGANVSSAIVFSGQSLGGLCLRFS